jgi:hypothetical protein
MLLFIGTRFRGNLYTAVDRPRVYLKEGTYQTRLFRGPSTNGMKVGWS